MKFDLKSIVLRLFQNKYSVAKVFIWAGSTSKGNYTSRSDLDIIVVYEEISHAFRETYIFEDWRVDAFIHSPATLRYFFDEIDKSSGRAVLPDMIISGILISPRNQLYTQIKNLAQSVIDAGPPIWDKSQIDKARFYITDSFDDVLSAGNYAQRVAAGTKLYEQLAEFYFRAQNKWQADGKSIISFLYKDNPILAKNFEKSFGLLFKEEDVQNIENLVLEILNPYGGLFWEGFHLDAPPSWKK